MMRKQPLEALKTILVILVCVCIVIFAAWFIPVFMRELSGTLACKYVGNVAVCVAVK